MRPLSFPVEKRGSVWSIENRSWKISHLRSSKPGAQRKRSNAGNVNRGHSSRRIPREREREIGNLSKGRSSTGWIGTAVRSVPSKDQTATTRSLEATVQTHLNYYYYHRARWFNWNRWFISSHCCPEFSLGTRRAYENLRGRRGLGWGESQFGKPRVSDGAINETRPTKLAFVLSIRPNQEFVPCPFLSSS